MLVLDGWGGWARGYGFRDRVWTRFLGGFWPWDVELRGANMCQHMVEWLVNNSGSWIWVLFVVE